MPKKSRTEKEINQIRKEILEQALDLIQEEGYEGFSMRKLSKRLGVSVVTLYRFYESKDHIYLAVLTKGFQLLYNELAQAYESGKNPKAKLKAIADTYLKFGIEQANFYNLMFTWHVPKYQDYVGTPMEEAALYELEESQKVYLFTIDAVKKFTKTIGYVTDDQIRSIIIFFWSTMHGYIAGNNNNVLSYMHEDPASLQATIVDALFTFLQTIIEEKIDNNKKN